MTLPKTVKVEGDDKNHHRPDISMSVFDDIRNEGWLIRISINDPAELDVLLSADEYQAMLEA